MPILLFLFVVVPIVELWLLIRIGGVIGAGWTIALVLATGVAGAALARREGLRTMQEMMRQSSQGLVPGQQLIDGVAIFLGGALLMTPGIVTDIVGFALLLPPSRAAGKRLLLRWLEKRVSVHQVPPDPPPPGPRSDQIYDQTFDDDEE